MRKNVEDIVKEATMLIEQAKIELADSEKDGPTLPPDLPPESFSSSSGQSKTHTSLLKREYLEMGEIGAGGMGKILAIKEVILDRDIAMKVMLSQKDRRNLAMFLREAIITAKLDHPNIPPIYDLGVNSEGNPFFTMKKVRGEDLRSIIENLAFHEPDYVKKFPVSKRVEIFKQVCYGVAYAHTQGIIHKDLKPMNIMIGKFGQTYVMDWGLAKMIGSVSGFDTAIRKKFDVADVDLTSDGYVLGTVTFMPPEQARGENTSLDQRTDIYALGCLLYNLLSFEVPARGISVDDTLRKVMGGDIVPLDQRSGRFDNRLVSMTMKCLAFQPEDRYQHVSELIEDIDAYVAQLQKSTGDLLRKALDALNRGAKYDVVLKIIGEAKKKDPESEEAYLTEGQVHEAFGKPDEAIEAYLLANDLRKRKTKREDTRAIFYAAEVARKLKEDSEQFIELYSRCMLAKDPHNPDVHSLLSEAYILLDNGEVQRSVTILNRILDIEPHSAEAYVLLGTIHTGFFDKESISGFVSLKEIPVKFNDRDKGIGYFTKAIDSSSGTKQSNYYALRAMAHMGNKAFDKAEEDLTEAIMLEHSIGNLTLKLQFLFETKKFDDALLLTNYLIKFLGYNSASLFSNRATLLRKSGLFDEAIEDFKTALRVQEEDPDPFLDPASVHCGWGLVFTEKGDFEEAISHYKDAIRENPRYIRALNNMADHYCKLGKLDEALECLTKVIDLREDHGASYVTRAEIFFKKWKLSKEAGSVRQAVDDWRKALTLRLKPAAKQEAVDNLGELYTVAAEHYAEEGSYERAIKACNEALNLEGLDPDMIIKAEITKTFAEKEIDISAQKD